MKTLSVAFVLCVTSAVVIHGQIILTNEDAVSHAAGQVGPHHREWMKAVSTTNALGEIIARTNRAYLELATGMHFKRQGQWLESKEQIEIMPGGDAAATNGQHQAYFPSDIFDGTIELVTPDAKLLRSRPLGLSYFDGSNSVLIAELTNSVGQILPSGNQVVYNRALDFADLRYTYTRAGLEQDVILRERPPAPEEFGLNPATTRLQVLTEFFSPPQPTVTAGVLPAQAGIVLINEGLDFGVMKIGWGRAFMLGEESGSSGALVGKQWLTLDGRQFLVEEVLVAALANELENLPPPGTHASLGKPSGTPSRKLALPVPRMAKNAGKKRIQRASLSAAAGLVLDYTLVTSQTNYTFEGDKTYYVSGTVNLSGTNTLEGGAVLKFATNGSIQAIPTGSLMPSINWKAGAYRPVIFTAKDDNSVGQSITNSTGNPTNYYGNPMLYIAAPSASPTLTGFRMSYAKIALNTTAGTFNFYDAQFINCQYGLTCGGGVTALLGNALFANTKTNLAISAGTTLKAKNVTFSGSSYLAAGSASPDSSIYLTNCIVADVTNLFCGQFSSTNGDYNGFYNAPYDPKLGATTFTNTFYPFQTVGAGNFYFASGCNFFNQGTTSIDSTLLAELKTKTTYPPIVFVNLGAAWTNDLNLFPQAQRDTDSLDLGYHYDPIDYAFGFFCVTNATVTVNPGTVIAAFGTNNSSFYGLAIGDNAQFLCEGTPTSPNRIVEYNTVQEGVGLGWLVPGYGLLAGVGAPGPIFKCRFTEFSVPAQDVPHIQSYVSAAVPMEFHDCQFGGGKLIIYYRTADFTNCLLARVLADLEFEDASIPHFRNNLIRGGSFGINAFATNAVIKDNLFDRATIPDWLGGNGNTYDGGYNAFVTNHDRLQPTNSSDVILSTAPDYQAGPLGRYYYPTNLSQLINAGSVTNAALVGLYHYTTTTNQLKETTSTVDIGFHYVAVNGSGIPIDTDGDGIPDYFEDTNGNGSAGDDPTSWQSYNSPNGLTAGNGLQVFTPLK